MAARKPSKTVPSVAEFIAALPEPLRSDVEALRLVVLGAAEGIGEEVKWNAPSFYTGEHFATMRLSGKMPLQLIFHLGTKKSVIDKTAIEDPEGLLQWLGPDRACVTFAEHGAVAPQAEAIRALVAKWVGHVPRR